MTLLCVCTYNRTRSVIMAALLEQHLARVGVDAHVSSAGTRAQGTGPTPATVRMLGARGLDVRAHRSSPVDAERVRSADLVVTAERAHVVELASRWPERFPHTWVLPELVAAAERFGGRAGRGLDEWLAVVGEGRAAGARYLADASIQDIGDPTGRREASWISVIDELDSLCARLAHALA